MRGPDNRCVCINDASCGANQVCDGASGQCKCVNNAGCPAGNFCNVLGYCQSASACTSNLDCPTGTFCDTTTTNCLADGPCTLDEHCQLNNVCSTATLQCRPGCRDDSDCAPKNSCVSGQCTFFCRTNDHCPVDEFCNTATGVCAPRSGRVDCDTCSGGFGCGVSATCLTFLTEGQTQSFCGHDCTEDLDCPSGYECGGVIHECSAGFCDAPPGGGSASCQSFEVENEGTRRFCTGANGQPIEYRKSCAPRSGSCPPVAAP